MLAADGGGREGALEHNPEAPASATTVVAFPAYVALAYSCRGALNRWNSNSAPPRSANIARKGSVMMSRTSPSTIRITLKIAEIMSPGYPRLRLG